MNFLIIILLFGISQNLSSQETGGWNNRANESITYYDRHERDTNVAIRVVFPVQETVILTFIDFSMGIGYGIVPGTYYIGIAGDIAIGMDWVAVFSRDEKKGAVDREYGQFGLSLGGRIYNSIKVFNFEINLFIGCDFLFFIFPMPYAGIELFFHNFAGFEYAHYLPTDNENPMRHRISSRIHL